MRNRTGIQAERLLLDTIERLRRNGAGGRAVYLHLSRLLPMNRVPVRLRVVARMFKSLETGHGAAVYTLNNGDLVILGRVLPETEIDLIIHRVRSLFEHDPLTYAGSGQADPDDPFVTWYALHSDHRALALAVEAVEQERLAALGSVGSGGMASPYSWSTPRDATPEPMGPRALERALDAFTLFDLAPHLRRQPAVRIGQDRYATIAFEEFFASIGGVQKALCPETVLTSDRWLFQEFSRALDRRVLEILADQPLRDRTGAISLNLNLESTRSPAFRRLVQTLGKARKLVVEVQVIDVFADIHAYEETRDTLRAAGHEVLIDGLSPVTLRLLDLRRLAPDYAKVLWNADLATEETADKTAAFAAEVKAVGPERVVLARCDTEAAVLWGLKNGIQVFQGRFIDAVLGTVTMAACPEAWQCLLSQCAARRAAVVGGARAQCPHPPGLDAVQKFSAPGVHKVSGESSS
jgi:EAL domain-containing protein (putative c-di-GMP-specific phosphodiesterase class I)